MAIEKRGSLWYNTISQEYYSHVPLEIGDHVEYSGNRSSTYEKGDRGVISSVSRGRGEWTYVSHTGRNGYDNVYTQDIKVQGDDTKRSAKNWKKVEPKVTTPLLESNDPVIVQEIKEVVVGSAVTIENVGEPINLDNMAAARAYTSNEISNSIRETNTYRQFAIYKRMHVARAKKPEIEFA